MALEKFRTLSRRPQQIGTNEVLLSGIICVSLNQKPSLPKFVEVTHNAVADKTALYIHKNRDKKKTEAAIDLREAKVFIEYETTHVIGIITRDNRIYTLELEKEREELGRFIAQWRSVLTVSQNPNDMFSVITVSGEDRGSVILINAPDNAPDVTFKHMSGKRKHAEIRLYKFSKIDKLSTFEVSVETQGGDSYHFISKRPGALIRKLTLKLAQEDDLPEILPTKSRMNSTVLYDSKQGYTPAYNQPSRDVAHIPDDYMAMDELHGHGRAPLPDPRQPTPSRLPPTLPFNGTSHTASTTVHAINQFPPHRQPPPSPDYTPMDQHDEHIPDDYQTMDDMNRNSAAHQVPEIPDYMAMDDMNRDSAVHQDPASPGYTNMDGMNSNSVIPDYIPMDGMNRDSAVGQEYQDPLIADYLDMATVGIALQLNFDDYPANQRLPDPDVELEPEEDECEDIYFDPSLMPPPIPPRVQDMPPRVQEPPPSRINRPGHPAVHPPSRERAELEEDDSIYMTHEDVRELKDRVQRNRSLKVKNFSGRNPDPPNRTLYSDVKLRERCSVSESEKSSNPAPVRRVSELLPRTEPMVPVRQAPPPPTSYCEVELIPRPDPGQGPPMRRRLSDHPPSPITPRRFSEQPPRTPVQDGPNVSQMRPALPPKTEKDQITPRPKPKTRDGKKKNKKDKRPKSSPSIPPALLIPNLTEETPSIHHPPPIKSPVLPPRKGVDGMVRPTPTPTPRPGPPAIPRRS